MRLVHGLAAAALMAGIPGARLGQVALGESPAAAQSAGLSQEGYQAYLPQLRAAAERAGIRAATLGVPVVMSENDEAAVGVARLALGAAPSS